MGDEFPGDLIDIPVEDIDFDHMRVHRIGVLEPEGRGDSPPWVTIGMFVGE